MCVQIFARVWKMQECVKDDMEDVCHVRLLRLQQCLANEHFSSAKLIPTWPLTISALLVCTLISEKMSRVRTNKIYHYLKDGLDQQCPVMWDSYGVNSFSTCPSIDASLKENIDVDKKYNCCKQKLNRNQRLGCQAMMNTHVMYEDNFMVSNPAKKAFKAESLSL